MNYVEIGTNAQFNIDAFKRYAKVVEDGDAVNDDLRDTLRAAAIRVQEHADRALLPCTITVDGEGAAMQLWQPIIATLVSAVDLATGEDFRSDCRIEGHTLVLPHSAAWEVTYTTEPNYYEVERLRPFVLELAAALWDGNTEEEAKVMQRIPIDYVVR